MEMALPLNHGRIHVIDGEVSSLGMWDVISVQLPLRCYSFFPALARQSVLVQKVFVAFVHDKR